jgi:hypothetical protein
VILVFMAGSLCGLRWRPRNVGACESPYEYLAAQHLTFVMEFNHEKN